MEKKRLWLLLSAALGIALASSPAQSTTVYMAFDGDATFPSITVTHATAGLGDFTGSAFGISSAADTAYLENAILTLVRADYAAYNIDFVTSIPVSGTYQVWGIDDTAYTFSDFCGMTVECQRLFGKADPTATVGDAVGYARTWAGSMSLDGVTNPYGGSATSSPELDISTHTLDQIAQALANNAAHEIAHLYGVAHEGLDAGSFSQVWNLMETNIESTMVSQNKYFSSTANGTLLAALGCNSELQGCTVNGGGDQEPVIPEPTGLLMFGLGTLLVGGYSRRRRA